VESASNTGRRTGSGHRPGRVLEHVGDQSHVLASKRDDVAPEPEIPTW
jgi:hypothetical protein